MIGIFSISQNKYNVNIMRNDATAAIMPHDHVDHLLLHIKWNQSLKTACPSANQSLPYHDLLGITYMTTEKQKQIVCAYLKGIEKRKQ